MNEMLLSLVQSIVGPAAMALFATLILTRLLAPSHRRYAAAIPFALAYCAGFALLRPWEEWIPSRHWHWTVYCAPAAALVTPLVLAHGVHRAERWLAFLLAALACAWLLVPDWSSLQPTRAVSVPLLAGYVFFLSALVEPLPQFLGSRTVAFCLALSAAATAGLVLASVSLTYGQLAFVAAGALAGCALASCIGLDPVAIRGLSLPYAAVVGGWSYVGCIDPPQPVWGLLLAPAAPLALWCCAVGPLSRWKGWSATAAQMALVLAGIGIAAALVLLPKR